MLASSCCVQWMAMTLLPRLMLPTDRACYTFTLFWRCICRIFKNCQLWDVTDACCEAVANVANQIFNEFWKKFRISLHMYVYELANKYNGSDWFIVESFSKCWQRWKYSLCQLVFTGPFLYILNTTVCSCIWLNEFVIILIVQCHFYSSILYCNVWQQ